jgi:aryl-alcohol dehydrogenase-like predicted oxidoreductase
MVIFIKKKTKSEFFSYHQEHYNFMENQFDVEIKILCNDNGVEFINHFFSKLCK